MKNLYTLLVVALTLSIASCSTMKSNSSSAMAKERMLMDANAMASIECEYKLSHLKLEDDRKDFKLQSQFATTRQDIAALSKILNKRYNDSTGLRPEFNKLVKSARVNLTICQQLQDYEDKREEKIIENTEEENNAKGKK